MAPKDVSIRKEEPGNKKRTYYSLILCLSQQLFKLQIEIEINKKMSWQGKVSSLNI